MSHWALGYFRGLVSLLLQVAVNAFLLTHPQFPAWDNGVSLWCWWSCPGLWKKRQSGCWRPTSAVKGREDGQGEGSVCSGAAMFAAGRVLVTACRVCVLSTLKTYENRITLDCGRGVSVSACVAMCSDSRTKIL